MVCSTSARQMGETVDMESIVEGLPYQTDAEREVLSRALRLPGGSLIMVARELGRAELVDSLFEKIFLIAMSDGSGAFREIAVAAEKGDAPSLRALGTIYKKRANSVIHNDPQKRHEEVVRLYHLAVGYYRRAAEMGDAEAQWSLGLMYQFGLGVEKDDIEAFRLYELSANLGNTFGQYYLAMMYLFGDGIPRDDYEAFRLLNLAAGQRNVVAELYLGYMYEAGMGIEQSDAEAVRLFHAAADQGEGS